MYQIASLCSKCELLLIEKLSVENAIDLFMFAFRHSRNKLKEAAMNFISRNISEVKKTEACKNLKTNPNSTDALLEMVDYISTNKTAIDNLCQSFSMI